jgi:hypothetical protein
MTADRYTRITGHTRLQVSTTARHGSTIVSRRNTLAWCSRLDAQCEQSNHPHSDKQHCERDRIVVQPIQLLLHGPALPRRPLPQRLPAARVRGPSNANGLSGPAPKRKPWAQGLPVSQSPANGEVARPRGADTTARALRRYLPAGILCWLNIRPQRPARPDRATPRSANKLKKAKQLSGTASASNKSRFMANVSVSDFAVQP